MYGLGVAFAGTTAALPVTACPFRRVKLSMMIPRALSRAAD